MKINGRDLCVALVACCLTMAFSASGQVKEKLSSLMIDWDEIPVKKTKVGEIRTLFRAPTATLEELECHITTLNPGETSHPPHKHAEEEVIIVKDGTVEQFANGKTKRLGPGSVIFLASQEMHGIRNVGQVPATYHVFSWKSAETLRLEKL
jgi:quercetin dioxygenase-like cupin family protein